MKDGMGVCSRCPNPMGCEVEQECQMAHLWPNAIDKLYPDRATPAATPDPNNDPERNPKLAAGRAKTPFRHVPIAALVHLGRVHASGADKYGINNWGEAGVVASVYYEAMLRHILSWWTGEDIDPESGEPHLAHVMAGCGIVIDCAHLGNLQDDRPGKGITPRTTPFSAVAKPPERKTVGCIGCGTPYDSEAHPVYCETCAAGQKRRAGE